MVLISPAHFHAAAVIQVAMDEEAAPFFDLSEEAGESFSHGEAEFYPRTVTGDTGEVPFLLVRSRIGLVNAAAAATAALLVAPDAGVLVSAGTAGGLRADVRVGDIAVGTDYLYTDADASAFGYARGQVPGMPERYRSPVSLVERVKAAVSGGSQRVLFGTMLSGGSFVTAANVADTRQVFPDAVSTDMETTAIAQVCASQGVAFIAARGISDLCGPQAGQDFHLSTDSVAPRSARLALSVVEAVASYDSEVEGKG